MFVTAPRYVRAARDWLTPPLAWVTVPSLIFIGAFCVQLWPDWSTNPDLSHGLFAPVIFALLLVEGVRRGTPRWLRQSTGAGLMMIGLVVIALGLFGFAGLIGAALGWSHSLVGFALAAALAVFLVAAAGVLASESVRAVPINWPVLTAIGLWLLAAPIPPGTYARLTLTLQEFVTSGVLNSLHILGVPARQVGNVIHLTTTSVGVEDACSGVRSLLSCLYAGFFFAAWLVQRTARRVLLIIIAPVLAVLMNFVRSLALTLMANSGVNIMEFWHDATGYAILGLTAVVLAVLANALASTPAQPRATLPAPTRARGGRPFGILAGGSAAILAVAIFFGTFNRSPRSETAVALSQVEELLPAGFVDWQSVAPPDLYRFSPILQTNYLTERTYWRVRNGELVTVNAYVAHWPAGQASVSLVATHTPDACWPGTGWEPRPHPQRQVALEFAGRKLPVAEHRLFERDRQPQHVWFWHVYDGRVIDYRAPYAVRNLVAIALEYGFRREGTQYFVRFSSNRPWEDLHDDPLVRQIFANFSRIGVTP